MANYVDSRTGTITSKSNIEIVKSDRRGMVKRDSSYLEGDERGHIQAASMKGGNKHDNVVPQHHDVNHGSYAKMEMGEKDAISNGAKIDSEKIAYVSNQPGHRPDCFIVNDQITYPNGHEETLHFSFQNDSNETVQKENDFITENFSDMLDSHPNPNDTLRENMSPEEYTQVMQETDDLLHSIRDEYSYTPDVDPEEAVDMEEDMAGEEVDLSDDIEM